MPALLGQPYSSMWPPFARQESARSSRSWGEHRDPYLWSRHVGISWGCLHMSPQQKQRWQQCCLSQPPSTPPRGIELVKHLTLLHLRSLPVSPGCSWCTLPSARNACRSSCCRTTHWDSSHLRLSPRTRPDAGHLVVASHQLFLASWRLLPSCEIRDSHRCLLSCPRSMHPDSLIWLLGMQLLLLLLADYPLVLYHIQSWGVPMAWAHSPCLPGQLALRFDFGYISQGAGDAVGRYRSHEARYICRARASLFWAAQACTWTTYQAPWGWSSASVYLPFQSSRSPPYFQAEGRILLSLHTAMALVSIHVHVPRWPSRRMLGSMHPSSSTSWRLQERDLYIYSSAARGYWTTHLYLT